MAARGFDIEMCGLVRREAMLLETDEPPVTASEAYVFSFRRPINSTARTFGEMVRGMKGDEHAKNLLAVVTRAIYEYGTKPSRILERKRKAAIAGKPGAAAAAEEGEGSGASAPRDDGDPPIAVRLEAVMPGSTDGCEEYAREVRERLAEGRTTQYADILDRAPVEMRDALAEYAEERCFLKVCQNNGLWEPTALDREYERILDSFSGRKPREWRLFVFVLKPEFNFVETLLGIIADNDNAFDAASESQARNKRPASSRSSGASAGAAKAPGSASESDYATVSRAAWIRVLYHASNQDPIYRDAEKIGWMMNQFRKVGVAQKDHLLHPERVFGVSRHFATMLLGVSRVQLTRSRYATPVYGAPGGSAGAGSRSGGDDDAAIPMDDETETIIAASLRNAPSPEESEEADALYDLPATEAARARARASARGGGGGSRASVAGTERSGAGSTSSAASAASSGSATRPGDLTERARRSLGNPVAHHFRFPRPGLVFKVDINQARDLAKLYMPCAVLGKVLSTRRRVLPVMRQRFAAMEGARSGLGGPEEEDFDDDSLEYDLDWNERKRSHAASSAAAEARTEEEELQEDAEDRIRVPNPWNLEDEGAAASGEFDDGGAPPRAGPTRAQLAYQEMEQIARASRDRYDPEKNPGELPVDVVDGGGTAEFIYRTEYDDLHDISEMLTKTLTREAEGEGPEAEERRKNLYEDRWAAKRWLLNEYRAIHRDPDSEIGKVGKLLLAGARSEGILRVARRHRTFDPTMSPFANYIIGLMMAFEKLLMFYGAHRTFLLMLIGTLDAYKETSERFGLKFNLMIQGDPSTGKSYQVQARSRCCIEGTIHKMGNMSNLAFTGNEQRTDMITFYEEFDGSNFDRHNKNRSDRAASVFKDKLTSFVVHTSALQFIKNRRVVVSTRSKQQECFICLTNQSTESWDEAFLSRFHLVMATTSPRPDKEHQTYQEAESCMTEQQRQLLEEFYAERKREQLIHYHVQKAIHSGVLDAPDLTVCHYLIDRVVQELQARKRVSVSNRLCKRIEIMVYLFVICTATQYIYNLPVRLLDLGTMQYVPNHYGEPFHERHLPEFDPYLHDTIEQVLFCIGLFSDQIESPLNAKVSRIMREINETDDNLNCRGQARFLPVRQAHHAQGGGAGAGGFRRNGGGQDELPRDPQGSVNYAAAAQAVASGGDPGAAPRPTRAESFDYTYCVVANNNGTRFAEKVISRWGDGEGSRPSENNIRAIVAAMSKKSVTSHAYELRLVEASLPDGRKTVFEIPVEGRERKAQRPLVLVDNDLVYVHSSFLYGTDRDGKPISAGGASVSLASVVKDCAEHAHTLERSVLYGEVTDPKNPHLFAKLDLVPRKDRQCVISRPNYWCQETLAVMGIPQRRIDRLNQGEQIKQLNVDDDSYSIYRRLLRLGLRDPTPSMIFAFHPTRFMLDIVSWFAFHPKVPAFSYPEDVLSAERDAEEESVRLKTLDVDRMSPEEREKLLAYNFGPATAGTPEKGVGSKRRAPETIVSAEVASLVRCGEELQTRLRSSKCRKELRKVYQINKIGQDLGVHIEGPKDAEVLEAVLKDVLSGMASSGKPEVLFGNANEMNFDQRNRFLDLARRRVCEKLPKSTYGSLEAHQIPSNPLSEVPMTEYDRCHKANKTKAQAAQAQAQGRVPSHKRPRVSSR